MIDLMPFFTDENWNSIIYVITLINLRLGMCLKASYSPPKSSSLNMHSVLIKETSLEGRGVNGSCATSSFSRRGFLLDGVQDEYQGFVVNPDRLPLNPSVFAVMLQASLSHWQLKVLLILSIHINFEFHLFCPVY